MTASAPRPKSVRQRALHRIVLMATMLIAVSTSAARAEPAALDLAQYRGKVVYLDFWASWCGPCKQAFPFMAELSRQYRPTDLVVITVNEERQHAPGEAFLRQVKSTLPVVWDGDGAVARPWAVNELPATLIFDRKGKMRFRHQGFVPANTAEYRKQLDSLVRER
jgi:thiol-disulfide isomerase/thioredoxin